MTRSRRQALLGYAFISPFLVGFLGLMLGPLVYSVFISLTRYTMLGRPTFIGVENYVRAFTADPLFWKSLGNTAYYVLLHVPLSLVGSLICALILHASLKGRAILRPIYYIPAIIPIVATAFMFRWLFRTNFGLVNVFLSSLGITGPNWLGDPKWALNTIIIISLWGVGGPTAMIFLAGLQGIDRSYYESATIDGASSIQTFVSITLPMIGPTILFNLVISLINSFQAFDLVFILTSSSAGGAGGPANSTLFYVLHLYRNAFEYFQVGYGAALAWVLFAIIMGMVLLQFRLSERWVYYGE